MAVNMAFIPVFSFMLLLAFGSVDSWASCHSYSGYDGYITSGRESCSYGAACSPSSCLNTVQCKFTCPSSRYYGGKYYTNYKLTKPEQCNDPPTNSGCLSTGGGISNCVAQAYCDTQCEADSLTCVKDGLIWHSTNCECLSMTDTVYNCINWSTSNIYGEPNIAHIQICVGGECHRKTTLNGTCQDWGFCPDGVQSCEIDKDSLGRAPCRRSGAETTSSNVCVYQCVSGQTLRCRPTSTQYVAGAIYVGTCPERPPVYCDPARSSSSVVSSSNSNSSDSHSSSSGGSGSSSSACVGDACGDNSSSSNTPPPNSSNSGDRDYMPILIAIHDTLVNANEQRKKIVEWGLGPYVQNIDDNTFGNFYETKQINNKLTTLQQNGFNIGGGARKSIDTTAKILANIDDFLHSDSLIITTHDTSYNPLIRDIKMAIESQTDSIVAARDTLNKPSLKDWFDRYYSDSAQSNGYVGQKLAQITDVLVSKRDSSLNADCNGYYGCLAVYKDLAYCGRSWGVSGPDCNASGTPLDNIWNIEANILSTLVDGIFGEDSTPLTSKLADTSYTPPSAADSAKNSLIDAVRGLFSSDSTNAILDKVNRMKDSVERSKDSVSIQPDSLWLDSSQAAQYAQNALITAPTVEECFVCHADLGTLGGLAPDGLVIHIDFANIGGFNVCAIIRAVVRIIGFVVCLSLTLGSWAAAFGYNPKNDA